MSDDLERRLRDELRRQSLPPAPESTRAYLEHIVDLPARRSRRPWLALVLIPVVVVLVGVAALIAGSSTPVPVPHPSPSATAPSEPALPATVDGLPVLTVSEVLAQRAAGELKGGPVALRGYWSDLNIVFMCAPPLGNLGVLEMYCPEGQFAISERDEPYLVLTQGNREIFASGPHLTPWMPPDPAFVPLFSLPTINGQQYPPVPIVVVGHFDDPRAAQCRPEARQLCRDRLVLDRIIVFDPAAEPTPGVTAPPTPFPSPAPPGLFGPAMCAGDVPYSLVGWTTTEVLQLPYSRPGHVWAMVTANAVPLPPGEWAADPSGSGRRFHWYGRLICFAEEFQPGVMGFGWVPGSTYQLWEDGRKTSGTP